MDIFFSYAWFDHPHKLRNTEFSPYDTLYSKIHSSDPLEAEYNEYGNLLKSGVTTDQAVIELKLSKPPPTGVENYQYLKEISKQEQLRSIKGFLF